jgi:two-component sensor histidine kinase
VSRGYVRPFSIAAVLIAIGCLLGASVLRIALSWVGFHATYALYFPAVLIAALLAGAPAGLAVLAGSAIIGLFTFAPPHADFAVLDAGLTAVLIFTVSALCVVLVAHLYRVQVERLQTRDEQRDLLMKELEHRGRNTYAIVDSIVRATLKNDPEHAEAISGRVRAVSRSNDLINWSQTTTVKLRTLLLRVFESVAKEQASFSGPDVDLTAAVARQLALVFHELVTNARKYGALSNVEGRIAITWTYMNPNVHLVWQETGGPKVEPPTRQGFGTEVVDRTLQSLSGAADRSYDPDGFSCVMTLAT